MIDRERPDVLVGNSCGSFYAQIVAPVVGIPALLGNPHFRMTEFLSARIGRHEYKSKRMDGKQEFVIDESLIAEFAEMEASQFLDEPSGKAERDCCNPYYIDKVWGIFGEQDTLARSAVNRYKGAAPYSFQGSIFTKFSSKIERGDRNIYNDYIAFCRWHGRQVKSIKFRRQVEYDLFFVR